MDKSIILSESKYIKSSRKALAFSTIASIFFFTLYVLPQYFGLPFPLFDFTVLRIMILILMLFIFGIKQNQKDFVGMVVHAPYSKILIPYLLVLSYTTILRVDINAFLNPVIELLSFYLLIYVIKNYFGVKKMLEQITVYSYVLTALGLVEYVIQRSPFSYLKTIDGIYSGQFIRSGYYRIMGPASHSLGYGLMLVTMVPILCYDIEKEEINILKHKLLLFMTAANIFFTGSRSTLSVFILELIILAFLSTKTNKKRLILIGSLFITAFTITLILLQHTSIAQYILLQITSVLDELMGTTYSVRYGADLNALGSSSNYRNQLIYIFKVDWLNPMLGIGRERSFSCEINGSYIRSVDSFYIAEFVRYAYPGMIFYIAYLLYFLLRMLKNSIKQKSQISRMLLTGSLCYCINLLWLDSLQTLKYLYVLFAIFCCLPANDTVDTKVIVQGTKILSSKYIK